MRFIAIYRPDEKVPPTGAQIETMHEFIDEAVRAGVLLATEGFGPSTPQDAKIRYKDGEFRVIDGPFAETKEAIGGFAIMKCSSREEAFEWTRRFLRIAGNGESEIRELYPMSPIEQVQGGS